MRDTLHRDLNIRLCVSDECDARLIMAWRNDPRTLAAFFHREPKQWSAFWPEYRDRYFTYPDLPPHFVCLDGAPIAFLRYVPADSALQASGSLDISLNLAPEARGRRLAAPVLARSLAFLSEGGFSGSVLAQVRAENAASRRTFRTAGFRDVDRVMHHVVDTGEVCPVDRLAYDIAAGATAGGPHSAEHGQRCIFVDLDGTLADTLPALRIAYDAFLARFDTLGTGDEFDSLNGPPLSRIVTILQERHNLPGSTEHLLNLYRELIRTAHRGAPAKAGAVAFVSVARERGWRIAIVTSSDRATAGAWLEAAGLAAQVEAIVAGEDVAQGKPAPDPYLLALKRLGGRPQDAFAVEDSRLGAQAAVDAGLETWVLSPDGPKTEWPGPLSWAVGFDDLSRRL